MVAQQTPVNGRCVAALRTDYKHAKDLLRSVGGDELKFGLYRNTPVVTTPRLAEWLADDELSIDVAKTFIYRTLDYEAVYNLCQYVIGDDDTLSAIFDTRFYTGKQGVILLTWQAVFLISLASQSKRGAMLRTSLKVELPKTGSIAALIRASLKVCGLSENQRSTKAPVNAAKQQSKPVSNVVKLEPKPEQTEPEELVSMSGFCRKYKTSSANLYIKFIPYLDFEFEIQGSAKCFKKQDEKFLAWLVKASHGVADYKHLVEQYNRENGTSYKIKGNPSQSVEIKPVELTPVVKEKPIPYDSADIDTAISLFSDPSLMDVIKARTVASIENHNQEIERHQQEIDRLNDEISKLQNVIARIDILMELN